MAAVPMETIEYRGYELTVLNLTSICTVNVSSTDPHLILRLARPCEIIQDPSREQSIAKAKQMIDSVLDGAPVT
jgi:hypothetical protein